MKKTNKKQVAKSICLCLHTQFKHHFCIHFSINCFYTVQLIIQRKHPLLPELRSSDCIPIYLSHLFHKHEVAQHIHLIPNTSFQRVPNEQGSTQNTGLNSPPSCRSCLCYRKCISHNSNLIPSYQLLLDESTRCPSCGNYSIFHHITQ